MANDFISPLLLTAVKLVLILSCLRKTASEEVSTRTIRGVSSWSNNKIRSNISTTAAVAEENKNNLRRAWITLLPEENYNNELMIGAQLSSIRKNSNYDHLTMVFPSVTQDTRIRLEKFGTTVIQINPITPPTGLVSKLHSQHSQWPSEQYFLSNLMHVWNFTQYTHVAYLDVNTFVSTTNEGDLNRIFDLCSGDVCGAFRPNKSNNAIASDALWVDTGVMVVRPNHDTFSHLLNRSRDFANKPDQYSDGGFISDLLAFPSSPLGTFTSLDWTYNSCSQPFFDHIDRCMAESGVVDFKKPNRAFVKCFNKVTAGISVYHHCGLYRLSIDQLCLWDTKETNNYCQLDMVKQLKELVLEVNYCAVGGKDEDMCSTVANEGCHWCGEALRCISSSTKCKKGGETAPRHSSDKNELRHGDRKHISEKKSSKYGGIKTKTDITSKEEKETSFNHKKKKATNIDSQFHQESFEVKGYGETQRNLQHPIEKEELNECAIYPDIVDRVCGRKSTCQDEIYGFSCACAEGYIAIADDEPISFCADYNECLSGNAKCDNYNGYCVDHDPPQMFECGCFPGHICVDQNCTVCAIDLDHPCYTDNGNCGENARCIPLASNGVQCMCNDGFIWDGTDCTPDETSSSAAPVSAPPPSCETFDCPSPSSRCVMNNAGVPTCLCNDGYFTSGSGSCQDIDECNTLSLTDCSPGGTSVCINLPGFYRCQCSTGFPAFPGTTLGTDCRRAEVTIERLSQEGQHVYFSMGLAGISPTEFGPQSPAQIAYIEILSIFLSVEMSDVHIKDINSTPTRRLVKDGRRLEVTHIQFIVVVSVTTSLVLNLDSTNEFGAALAEIDSITDAILFSLKDMAGEGSHNGYRFVQQVSQALQDAGANINFADMLQTDLHAAMYYIDVLMAKDYVPGWQPTIPVVSSTINTVASRSKRSNELQPTKTTKTIYTTISGPSPSSSSKLTYVPPNPKFWG